MGRFFFEDPELPAGALPTRLAAPLDSESAGRVRALSCPSYDLCLGHAAAMEWGSFSCLQCPHAGTARRVCNDEMATRHPNEVTQPEM